MITNVTKYPRVQTECRSRLGFLWLVLVHPKRSVNSGFKWVTTQLYKCYIFTILMLEPWRIDITKNNHATAAHDPAWCCWTLRNSDVLHWIVSDVSRDFRTFIFRVKWHSNPSTCWELQSLRNSATFQQTWTMIRKYTFGEVLTGVNL